MTLEAKTDRKYIFGIFRKYLILSPLILIAVILHIVTKGNLHMIASYITFDAFHIIKKTKVQIFIDQLIRLLTFFIIYDLVILFIN